MGSCVCCLSLVFVGILLGSCVLWGLVFFGVLCLLGSCVCLLGSCVCWGLVFVC